jgi:transcriptional regulator with XRE-family HTH domain
VRTKTANAGSSDATQPEMAVRTDGLAMRLRQARKAQGLRLTDVAKRTGLTIGLISQVERGLTTPSMRSLRQLADALGIQVDELFRQPPAASDREADHIVRKDRRRVLNLERIGMHMEILTPKKTRAVQAFAAYLLPGGISGTEFDAHHGQECGIIVDGQLELWLGKEKYLLGAGDCFSFNSRTPHRYRNPGPTMAYIHWVIAPAIY